MGYEFVHSGEFAVVTVEKRTGGRSLVVNESQRGLFFFGDPYFNHRLKAYPKGSILNVTLRFSKTGRRMVQAIAFKKGFQR